MAVLPSGDERARIAAAPSLREVSFESDTPGIALVCTLIRLRRLRE